MNNENISSDNDESISEELNTNLNENDICFYSGLPSIYSYIDIDEEEIEK